jgi:hypothetical protein
MQDGRFNKLVNATLHNPIPEGPATVLRRALQFVVQSTGEPGEKALEEFCRQREEQDIHEDRA